MYIWLPDIFFYFLQQKLYDLGNIFLSSLSIKATESTRRDMFVSPAFRSKPGETSHDPHRQVQSWLSRLGTRQNKNRGSFHGRMCCADECYYAYRIPSLLLSRQTARSLTTRVHRPNGPSTHGPNAVRTVLLRSGEETFTGKFHTSNHSTLP